MTVRFALAAVVAAAIIASMSTELRAQDMVRTRCGVSGGVSVNDHRADFRALPGVPGCCPNYQSGSGKGPTFGMLGEWPIAHWLLVGAHVDYTSHNARLDEREPVRLIVNGQGRDGAFEHSVDATLS